MALDESDLKKLAEMITASTKDLVRAADIGGVVESALAVRLKDIPTADSVTAAAKAAAAEMAKPAEAQPNKAKAGDDPALAALKAQIEETNAKLAAADRARVDAERKATADANLSRVRDALGKAGVAPERMHLAIAAVKESGALILDGDKVGWKGKDSYGLDATLDFDAGAKLWASTNDGKTFLPAVDARGTGDGKNNRNGSNPGAITNLSDLRATIGADLLNSI